ncbi:DUF6630 family protein [Nocardia mikamii]|uniref:DUF6630 family protein n=1 Tax=Nocardia mikamii TaxID=508464 RepID=UPI003F76F96D
MANHRRARRHDRLTQPTRCPTTGPLPSTCTFATVCQPFQGCLPAFDIESDCYPVTFVPAEHVDRLTALATEAAYRVVVLRARPRTR